MTRARIRWLAVGAAVLVAALGYLSLTRTVTILADGRNYTITTRAIFVGGALRQAGVQLGTNDSAEPGAGSLMFGDTTVSVDRAARIQLLADGELYQTESRETSVPILLAQFGLSLNPGDRVLLAGRTITFDEILPAGQFLSLELRRAVTVTLEEAGEEIDFASSAPTLGEALAGHGIQLSVADRLVPGPETPLTQNLRASLDRAVPVQIGLGDEELQVYTSASTVGEALAEAGMALQGLDYSEPGVDAVLPADGQIRVVRVSEKVEVAQQIVLHSTELQPDPEAEFGTTSVIQEGKDGISSSRERVRYEDGEEASRTQEPARVLVEAVTQINGYGSEISIKRAVVDGVEIEYWATMTMWATSYSPCRSGVEACLYGTATSGVSVARGVAATYVDWFRAARGLPFYVSGYGHGGIYDTGGGYPDGRAWIDLGYSDDDWVGWADWVTVYFTTPVPEIIPYWIIP